MAPMIAATREAMANPETGVALEAEAVGAIGPSVGCDGTDARISDSVTQEERP